MTRVKKRFISRLARYVVQLCTKSTCKNMYTCGIDKRWSLDRSNDQHRSDELTILKDMSFFLPEAQLGCSWYTRSPDASQQTPAAP